MPLKHSTETLLVFVLAAAIALSGFIVAILPPLPAGSPAWGTAFIVSLIYPLALYPLLKSSRADYSFRALHFAPALMLVLWLLLQIGSSYVPLLGMLLAVYTWGWTAIAVLAAIGLLAWFCHSVIRQGVLRLGILAAVLLPFLLLGLAGEQWNWSERITAGLSSGWNKVASSVSSSSSLIAGSSSSASSTIVAMNASSSSSAGYDHSAYRRRLHILDLGSNPETSSSSSSSSSSVSSVHSSSSRAVAMASSASSGSRTSSSSSSNNSARPGFFAHVLAFFWGSPASSTGSSSMSAMSSSRSVSSSSRMVAMSSSSSRVSSSSSRSSLIAAVSSSSKSVSSAQSSVSSKPQRLPQTGFGLGEAALLLSAGYCGLLHARARRARQA